MTFIESELLSIQNPEKAKFLQRYFKTGKGGYAEGDVMLGIVVPLVRDVVKRSPALSFDEIQELLNSIYHEVRLAGFLILVKQFNKSKSAEERKKIFDFYLKNAKQANNWDLVDLSCRDIVGTYLLDKNEEREILYKLAESDNLWEQRIAIVSTWAFIKEMQFEDIFQLTEKLINHKHDLIHKAMGWMLREVGKRNEEELVAFLDKYATSLPRTTLRYAIERFDEETRLDYLHKK